jgi:hypothetical protein
MSPARKNDVEEERLAALEEMGIEEKALVYDEAGDKLLVSDDLAAIKDFYARAFQEWSLGNVAWKCRGNGRRNLRCGYLSHRRRLKSSASA